MKNFTKLIIYLIVVAVLVLGLFTISYLYLSTEYVESKCESELKVTAESAATSITIDVSNDYKEISEKLSSYSFDTVDSAYDDIKSVINTESSIHKGYYTSDNKVVLDSTTYNLLDSVKTYGFYTNDISVFRPLYIAEGSTDKTSYVFFEFDDYFIYFDSASYINSKISGLDAVKDRSYLLFEKNGYVGASSTEYDSIKTLYIDGIKDYNNIFDYDGLKENFDAGATDSLVLNLLEDNKVFFSYAPVLSEYNSDLFYALIISYNDVLESNRYLLNTLIVLSCCVFAVTLFTFILLGYSIYKQEEDISLAQATFFVKPFTIKITSKGRILKGNKSCERNIDNFRLYRNVKEFPVENLSLDMNTLIKKQIAFTAKFNRPGKDEPLYVRFIPMRLMVRYMLLGSDVTIEENERMKTEKIALFNQVTNLPNGNQLSNALNSIIKSSFYPTANISVASIDIMEFAKINTIYGFEPANKVLRSMAETLNRTCEEKLPEKFSIYNIRTSLFYIIFMDYNSFNDVISWSKYAVDELAKPISVKEDLSIEITPKMGLVNLSEDIKKTATSQTIYDYAAKALNRATTSKLSKVSLYNAELSLALSRDQVMEQDLRDAIKNDDFVMYFQPQFSSSKNKIIGFESLLRWNNPKYKNESPEHYVTIAEKNGMIIELGKLINDKVFAFAKTIEGEGISISLNVSPVQLFQPGFVYELTKCFDDHELKPGAIAIEITETFLMENRDMMISKLRLLREKGFEIHLDDFGVGYSSMLYLKDLPVNAIKIDKEFTKYMMTDKVTRIIVSKIVQMGVSLNLDIICEGVETDKQKDTLSKMGCDIIQGYYISKPASPDETYKLIEKYNGIKTAQVKDFINKGAE